MNPKQIIENQPILAYFSGPTGCGRFKSLTEFIASIYQPGESELSQLQNILSDYPQIFWLSGAKVLLNQNEKIVNQHAPGLMKYSHFDIYNFAYLNQIIKQHKNLIVVLDESCIRSDSNGAIASRARELQIVFQLVREYKVSLIIEGSQMPMAVKYSANLGYIWDENKFIVDKNVLK